MPEGNSSFLLIFMLLAVAGLFFMNSRARKRQQAAVSFRDNLTPGQNVMTTSGMFATVTAIDGDKVTLITSGGQESEWLLVAIAKLVEDEEPDEEDELDDVEDEADDPTSRYVADAADAPPHDLGPDGTGTERDDESR